MIKAKIRLPHSHKDKYFVYVFIDALEDDVDSIVGHCCSCKIGSRVVGCCSHVAVVIWYLCYARYLNTIPAPAHRSQNLLEDNNSDSKYESEEEQN